MGRRVWDTFLFNDELDLLECRLTELDSSVYRFVICEAPVTHQGQLKPLHYLENKDRFAPWSDKIVHVIADLDAEDTGEKANWARENGQRRAISQGLAELEDDDIFLLSDADEIPFPRIIQDSPGHVLCMRNHLMAVNLLDPGWWAGTVSRYGRHVPRDLQILRDDRQYPSGGGPLKDKFGWPLVAGWHFSWLGGPEVMKAKVAANAHAEQREHVLADAEHMYAEKKCYAGAERHILEVVIDEKWPKYMQERRGPEWWYWPGKAE